jgi:alcohol dehydrogenase
MSTDQKHPSIPMDKVIANELEILGSHGMQAYKYQEMLRMIKIGKLFPDKLIGKCVTLEQSLIELVNMDKFNKVGVTVINQF